MYYRVLPQFSIPISPTAHYEYGFELSSDFFAVVRGKLSYAGRVGKLVERRDVRVCLQLFDQSGSLSKERVWFYDFMLTHCPPPLRLYDEDDEDDELEQMLNDAWGFPPER